MEKHGQYRALVGLGLALLAGPAAACQLALALALDVSTSVDAQEYRLQRDGLAAALASREVQAAILAQPGGIALAVYEWSGTRQQLVTLDWMALDDTDRIGDAARRIGASERSFAEFPTALGNALGFGLVLLQRAPACARQTIDLSGDGIHNDGFAPRVAYRHFPVDGVTVNGLVVDTGDPEVAHYYGREVIRGPGAFVEVAGGYSDYARAIKRKLLREISVLTMSAAGQAVADPEQG